MNKWSTAKKIWLIVCFGIMCFGLGGTVATAIIAREMKRLERGQMGKS